MNLSVMLLLLLNVTIMRAAFGKGNAQQKRFLLAMKNLSISWDSLWLICFLHGIFLLRSTWDGASTLNEIIEEYEEKKLDVDDTNEDLVDILLRIKRSGEMHLSLTIENVKDFILDLFLTGTDTLSTTLVWAMTELIRHPNVMQNAQLEVRKALNGEIRIEERDIHELPYINQVIKETLRLHPLSPLLVPRLCCETVELVGYTMPVESRVKINVWEMMRDPKYWEDPEKIDFGLANFEFIPFGGGRRICLGKSFALASIELWLAQLLFYFDWELLGGRSPQELDVDEAFGLTLTRKDDIFLVATYQE
ncbi:hypothetical protein IEQ34_007086 [Dendrobium chrysotoxum]|uniref:Cytochrome P450 n=1 Tax=Dendrobium chrysotoxum TaxID=161865 RepID=A0AAV7H9Y2_DENCH|nr:hypothetical protein IEQ34_007086 [Dendrobium chrysotoxum]